MKDKKLDELVDCGAIKSYEYVDVDFHGFVKDDKIGEDSEMQNSQRIKIVFPNGADLTVDAFCSGSLENVSFSVS